MEYETGYEIALGGGRGGGRAPDRGDEALRMKELSMFKAPQGGEGCWSEVSGDLGKTV